MCWVDADGSDTKTSAPSWDITRITIKSRVNGLLLCLCEVSGCHRSGSSARPRVAVGFRFPLTVS